MASSYTPEFYEVLKELKISLFVTTYQAGKLVMLRAVDGALNTHFCSFRQPMGLALTPERFAIGTPLEIWEYRNTPAVGRRRHPECDACFLPRAAHVTGNIQIHEMAYSEDELWLVNTRFSCLCTLDRVHSFVPRWKPPFISTLAPEDRCHLNGLCLVEGRPRYVTAMGTTDGPGGWRADKAGGGVVMEVPSGDILAEGLSMPHSPRWYDDRLWVLNSGRGELGGIDLKSLRYVPVVETPGFTRGLDFFGKYAFVGLSQVRESAIFSGIEITRRVENRMCGVCLVDITTGTVVGLLRFDAAVQEIFAVHVLPHITRPDVINDDANLISDSFVVPDASMADVDPSVAYRSEAPNRDSR